MTEKQTHTNTEAVSDERLAEFLLDYAKRAGAIGIPGSIVPILTKAGEALSRRSASNTGGVEVKAGAELPHPDNIGVDQFAAAMKAKLKWEREQRGRSGWMRMSAEELTQLLVEHLPKGDPVDVANFCMMLHQNGQRILSSLAAEAEPVAWRWREPPSVGWHFYLKDGKDDTGPKPHAGRIIQRLYTHPSSSVSAEVTVTDEMVERALRAYFPDHEYDLHTGMGDEIMAKVAHDMRAALTAAIASINGGRENG